MEYVLRLFAKRDWLCSTCLDKAASIAHTRTVGLLSAAARTHPSQPAAGKLAAQRCKLTGDNRWESASMANSGTYLSTTAQQHIGPIVALVLL